MEILEWISAGVGVVGLAVIVWGTLLTLVRWCRLEAQQVSGKNICHERELMRHHFGSYLLLGLEFLVGADIIRTVTKPTLEEMAILASIVGVRTVLSFFLNRDLSRHTCGMQEEGGGEPS